jgi:hypothetical protein
MGSPFFFERRIRMLKREITYEDYNGETVTETFYFNLAKSEIIELEVGYKGGLEETIKRIIAAEDNQKLIAEFKKLVLLAYGVKSEDGKRFIKSDALREEFSQTAAYDALFMELATDDGAAATFVTGIIPKDLAAAIPDQPQPMQTVELPPPPPKVS